MSTVYGLASDTVNCLDIIYRVASKSVTSWQLPRVWGSYGKTCFNVLDVFAHLQNCFDHPIAGNKNPRLRALHLGGRNEFRFWHFINTFSFLAAGFCPKNLAFAQK